MLEIFEPKKDSDVEGGTVARGNATCPVTGFTTRVDSVRAQLKKRRGGAADARLFCIVTTRDTEQGRFYRLPTKADQSAFEAAATELERRERADGTERSQAGRAAGHRSAAAGADKEHKRSLVPDEVISLNELRRVSVPIYGMERWGDLFTPRQALALTTLARLVLQAASACAREEANSLAPGVAPGGPGMAPGGPGTAAGWPGTVPGRPGTAPGGPGDGSRMAGDSSRKAGNGCRMAGDSSRKAGDGSRRAGDGSRRSGDGLFSGGNGRRQGRNRVSDHARGVFSIGRAIPSGRRPRGGSGDVPGLVAEQVARSFKCVDAMEDRCRMPSESVCSPSDRDDVGLRRSRNPHPIRAAHGRA